MPTIPEAGDEESPAAQVSTCMGCERRIQRPVTLLGTASRIEDGWRTLEIAGALALCDRGPFAGEAHVPTISGTEVDFLTGILRMIAVRNPQSGPRQLVFYLAAMYLIEPNARTLRGGQRQFRREVRLLGQLLGVKVRDV